MTGEPSIVSLLGGAYMREIILTTITGFMVGLIFARLKLPIPAPPTLAGVMGIVGLFLGYLVATRLGLGR